MVIQQHKHLLLPLAKMYGTHYQSIFFNHDLNNGKEIENENQY